MPDAQVGTTRCTCRGQCGNPHPFRVVIPAWVAQLLRDRGVFDAESYDVVGEGSMACNRITWGDRWCGECRSSRKRQVRTSGGRW